MNMNKCSICTLRKDICVCAKIPYMVLFGKSRFVAYITPIYLFCTYHYICFFSEIFGVQLEHLYMFIVQKNWTFFELVCYFLGFLFNQEHMSSGSKLVFQLFCDFNLFV
jgi:hypothetical protein